MELYQEIRASLPTQEDAAVRDICYRALEAIRRIVRDDSLDDEACFRRIEEIVSVLESIGSHGGNRHDFG